MIKKMSFVRCGNNLNINDDDKNYCLRVFLLCILQNQKFIQQTKKKKGVNSLMTANRSRKLRKKKEVLFLEIECL